MLSSIDSLFGVDQTKQNDVSQQIPCVALCFGPSIMTIRERFTFIFQQNYSTEKPTKGQISDCIRRTLLFLIQATTSLPTTAKVTKMYLLALCSAKREIPSNFFVKYFTFFDKKCLLRPAVHPASQTQFSKQSNPELCSLHTTSQNESRKKKSDEKGGTKAMINRMKERAKQIKKLDDNDAIKAKHLAKTSLSVEEDKNEDGEEKCEEESKAPSEVSENEFLEEHELSYHEYQATPARREKIQKPIREKKKGESLVMYFCGKEPEISSSSSYAPSSSISAATSPALLLSFKIIELAEDSMKSEEKEWHWIQCREVLRGIKG
ncbi:uncharacterized protein MONOS_11853 [Monocercomonoides exilis]|uniref:uncharacterized protein n=1 Tax=Monocercomonoides exilis TaxID=2049356 RepID=UPI0035595DC2|nr:hypothetical protein MONOS_11853 [Monocercomonoides exilis]|eukprot:MONOS_11853.1-p1 / transcript=MONOS_11853.1 / gene=MONOS_11853 / organism=Monocercomonoides_exilis_PA203 / gene_product=unspecified product / transcript_product=unspecified product / location=Mono_scaffold00618:27641-28717(-) / protein_length=321 / sequence_SO=supercontig / SO=protein_coding / is_pseudo=false